MAGLDDAQRAGREFQHGDGEGLAPLPGHVQDRPHAADRPEEVQGEVEPVHAGVVKQAAAGQARRVPPAAPGGSHAQAQPDQHGPADAAAVDEPLGLGMRCVEELVMGHAEGHARRRRSVNELLAFIEADRQRLFHQHVLASPDRPQCYREVQVMRQADGYGADLWVADQLTGIPVGPDAPAAKGGSSSSAVSATATSRAAADRPIPAACTWPISPRPISPTAPAAGGGRPGAPLPVMPGPGGPRRRPAGRAARFPPWARIIQRGTARGLLGLPYRPFVHRTAAHNQVGQHADERPRPAHLGGWSRRPSPPRA